MAIDRLTEFDSLPAINVAELTKGGSPAIAAYLFQLVKALDQRVRAMEFVINNMLFLTDDGVVYFGLPDHNGVYDDDTFRLIAVSDSIELQLKVAGAWLSGDDSIAKWAQ